jgi:hypothetical protein
MSTKYYYIHKIIIDLNIPIKRIRSKHVYVKNFKFNQNQPTLVGMLFNLL